MMMTHHDPQFDWPPLLILGASTRAAAGSAVRAGFRPTCADRFQDEDLHRLATVLPVDDYPSGLLAAAESLPPTPWLYTGAFENEPKLIAAITRRHPLLGNAPEVLRRVRDPFWLERTLRAHELPALKHRAKSDIPPADGGWLIKPRRSGGGTGIRIWEGISGTQDSGLRTQYFQERRDGRPVSALFLASPSDAQLLGLCEQLIGVACGAPTEFGYAGSIGPIEVNVLAREFIQRIGVLLAREAGLRGLFGCDFMLADDVPWLTEVNPRYTASVEVLERASRQPMLGRHVTACLAFDAVGGKSASLPLPRIAGEGWGEGAGLPENSFRPPAASERASESHTGIRVSGKRIVYAATDAIAPPLENLIANESRTSAWLPVDQEPLLADIPTPHSHIVAGGPICTVFTQEESVAACRSVLESRARTIQDWMRHLP